MTTDCPICCSPYNKSTAKCITCPRHDCGQSACKACVSTYLLGSNSDPHCMHCRVGWDHNFLAKNLTMKFLKNDYAEHRQKFFSSASKLVFLILKMMLLNIVACKTYENKIRTSAMK